MLEQLDVKEYALIDHISIAFDTGFTILTGETGAGKSILAGALGLLLGFKSQPEAIRTGSEQAEVSGIVHVGNCEEAQNWLKENGIKREDDTILIRRVVKKNGRGSIYIQSSQVTRAQLLEFMALLFDIHGQHEHQSLLVLENHRKLLDRYGGLESQAEQLKKEFTRLSDLKKRKASLLGSERERLREMDILSFAMKEIDDASLISGEEENLQKERKILQEHEKLFTLLDSSYESTAENKGGSLTGLRSAKDALSTAAAIDPSLAPFHQRLETAFYEVEDISDSIRAYRSAVNFSPERLEECEERLNLIHQLEKKYGASIEEVLAYREESEIKLNELENWETDKETLQAEITQSEQLVLRSAGQLSEQRKKAAEELRVKIESVLHNLGMPKSVFTVQIQQKSSEKGKPICGPYGIDFIEFLISANTGEKLKPLRSIASGGEISRIMLAIKSVLSESDKVTSLIFDEIDSGIGGEVAVSIGEHLHSLSRRKQVLCITHLATIAVRADNHIKIEKNIYDNRTVTECRIVQGEEKIREISRMLAGDTEGSVSLQHARELLNKYRGAACGKD